MIYNLHIFHDNYGGHDLDDLVLISSDIFWKFPDMTCPIPLNTMLEAKTRAEQKGLVQHFICQIILNSDDTDGVVFDLSKVSLPLGAKPG